MTAGFPSAASGERPTAPIPSPDPAAYRPAFVARRLRGMAEGAGPHALARALSVPVTRFRRDPVAFRAVSRLALPELLGRGEGPVRILSAGCATGEETWTLAVEALEASRLLAVKRPIRVLGFDLDTGLLETAAAGRYPATAVAGYPAAGRWFETTGGRTLPGAELRAAVRFRRGDVLRPCGARIYDLVACRNLLIYLRPAARRRALDNLLRALRPGGFLLLGRSEHPGAAIASLAVVDRRARLYRVPGAPAR